MYGQCVFETIAISNGQACLLDAHLSRLELGAKRLGLSINQHLISSLRNDIEKIITGQIKAVVRVNLTMGTGGRGYANPTPDEQTLTRIVSLHDYPPHPPSNWQEGIVLGVADIRLSHQPYLAGLKHGNRLEQIIARSQWADNWHEALLMDLDGHIVEATQSNVFIVHNNKLITPSLNKAGVAGVMRECIMNIASSLGIEVQIKEVTIDEVKQADAVFLSNSVIGLWPVKALKSRSYNDLTLPHKLLKIITKNEFIPNF